MQAQSDHFLIDVSTVEEALACLIQPLAIAKLYNQANLSERSQVDIPHRLHLTSLWYRCSGFWSSSAWWSTNTTPSHSSIGRVEQFRLELPWDSTRLELHSSEENGAGQAEWHGSCLAEWTGRRSDPTHLGPLGCCSPKHWTQWSGWTYQALRSVTKSTAAKFLLGAASLYTNMLWSNNSLLAIICIVHK